MEEKRIIEAYCKIRTIDNTIPHDVLDFMKDAAIEKINTINKQKDVCPICNNTGWYKVASFHRWAAKCDCDKKTK